MYIYIFYIYIYYLLILFGDYFIWQNQTSARRSFWPSCSNSRRSPASRWPKCSRWSPHQVTPKKMSGMSLKCGKGHGWPWAESALSLGQNFHEIFMVYDVYDGFYFLDPCQICSFFATAWPGRSSLVSARWLLKRSVSLQPDTGSRLQEATSGGQRNQRFFPETIFSGWTWEIFHGSAFCWPSPMLPQMVQDHSVSIWLKYILVGGFNPSEKYSSVVHVIPNNYIGKI